MNRISWKQLFLIAVCAAVLTYSMVQIAGVGDHLQYVAAAPAPVIPADSTDNTPPNQGIVQWQKQLTEQAEEWRGTMRLWTLDGAVERISFTSADASHLTTAGRLTLFGRYGQDLHPLVLCAGRALYPEELTRGDRVAVLDEQLALALFRVGDPIDRLVTIAGEKYRVVGVARHARHVGDAADFGAYIPLMSVIDLPLSLDLLTVEAAPLKGVGAAVSFRTVTENWQPGGTLIDLGKESTGAWLWLRALGFAAGMLLLLRVIHRMNEAAGLFAKTWRQRLGHSYAMRLLPWAAGRVLLFAAGYLACAAAFAVLMQFILAPVYVFPEWIPSVLVEWQDIDDTFWKVWQGFAAWREVRTPELMRLRFFTLAVDGFSALAGAVLAMSFARASGKREQTVQGLRAMYHQGVTTTKAITSQPLRLTELGFVTLGAQGTQTEMVRVVNAQQLLALLPPPTTEGSFVLEVADAQVPENHVRLRIVAGKGKAVIRETGRAWDLQLSIGALTKLVYGTKDFQTFTECESGFDLKMRSPVMDELFANHLQG